MTGSEQSDDALRIGREAVDRLLEWKDVDKLPRLEDENAARAAIEHLGELMASDHPLFRASRRGAERGAESLSPRPFQGILEVLQNADDLNATELRLAVRSQRGVRELLIVHNGDPVELGHVGAMVMPWVTTKGADADASGRWGIGQMTLRALGGPIELHCRPYHFRMDSHRPHWCDPVPEIENFYSQSLRDTLLRIPLLRSIDVNALAEFLSELGVAGLLFLRHVRRLYLLSLTKRGEKCSIDHRLDEIEPGSQVNLQLFGHELVAERLYLHDPVLQRSYTRYLVDRPLTKSEQRHHKETGKTTPLGVAFPHDHGEIGGFYDRLPLPIPSAFPFSLNAQFDPVASRSDILENLWNEHRLDDLSELLAAAAIDRFGTQFGDGWWSIPLQNEIPEGISSWLAERLKKNLVIAAQQRTAERLRFRNADEEWSIDELCFERSNLDGLLTALDQECLARRFHALLPEQRDEDRRWRLLLLELNRSHQIEVQDALNLFDEEDEIFGVRDPSWYVAIARVAIDADLLEEFLSKRGILLANSSRIEPPGHTDHRSLVSNLDPRSLAAALSLALRIHPAYLADDRDARFVVDALRSASVLMDHADADDVALEILARESQYEPLRLGDQQLLALRDAVEKLDEARRRDVGERVGANIELRGYAFAERGEVEERWISPTEAYLPGAVDRETDSFAKAAHKTPGLLWFDTSYAKLLKRTDRRELGAQRFLVLLGGRTAPRLIPPINESTQWKRDTRPASPIHGVERTELQTLEIAALASWPSHLIHDNWSPDLEAVILDIKKDRKTPRRRRRALALLSNLARVWDRTYADHIQAEVVWGSDGYWHRIGDVTASWLAFAASGEWLPSATGRLKAPKDLCLPTQANLIAHANDRAAFLAKIDDQVLKSPALVGLHLKTGPSARSIVRRLEDLRDSQGAKDLEREVRTAYHLLALACPDGDTRGKLIGDMTPEALRASFSRDRGKRGLLFINDEWCAPNKVFSGPPIFGRRRHFVPHLPHLAPLWRALQINKPGPAECVAVLREFIQEPLSEDDQGILLETYRYLTKHLDELSPALRRHLRRLAIWNGRSWISARPIYALDNDAHVTSLVETLNLWNPGFRSFDGFEKLLEALDITLIRSLDFRPISLRNRGAIDGELLRPRFAAAIDHLRAEIVRSGTDPFASPECSWSELSATKLIIDPDLELELNLMDQRRVLIPADSHILRQPITLIVRSIELIGSAVHGGRAVSSLFEGDQQKVAWAWVSMWQRAESGYLSDRLVLPTESGEILDESPLLRLETQVMGRSKKTSLAKGTSDVSSGLPAQIRVRRLKDLSQLEVDNGKHINSGARSGGVIFPTRKSITLTSSGGGNYTRTSRIPTSTRSVLPPMDARESLAFEAVRQALRMNHEQLTDLRSRRGIGADAIDELGQFFEIKMVSAAEVPDTITLLPSEVERAQIEPDFFLAVVSGLDEDSGDLRVRFIFDPLNRLSIQIRGEVTLSGVRQADALEFIFHSKETSG